ncbi:ankyrin-3-like [Ylistrum balloti]|uniref:ankyrin-3-like n=1 Tax=Ylistrum balloti TaxID=509963 RepID=UPI002905F6F5|nr:ankyrin-3-like [Ylistrum balloti]
MDDLPECMRKRPRRQSLYQGEAREVSTDGDYSTLRESRLKRAKLKPLDDVEDDDDDDDENPVVSSFDHVQSSPDDDEYAKNLFRTIENGNISEILELINQADLYLFTCVTSVGIMKDMNVLHCALHHKRFDVAKILIEKAGAVLASQTFSLPGSTCTALHQITENNAIDLAKLILKAKSKEEQHRMIKEEQVKEIQNQRSRSFSCFHLAAFYGYTELVRLYLSTGIDVNMLNSKNDSAILWASRWGHDDTVSLLLDNNADANIENDKKSTALHWAVRYQQSSTVKLLLKKGNVNPNHIRSMGLVAPLVLSSAIGNNRIVKTLLSQGADVNIVIRGGECALHHAAKEGHIKVVKTLLRYGANINKQDEKGDMAINLASQKGHADIVNILLTKGANMFHNNDVGEDCWDNAIQQEANGVLQVLAKHYKAAKSNMDLSCVPPICVAARLGRNRKIKALLQMKLDPEEVDFDGNTCLHYAAMYNRAEVIREFGNELDVDKQNKKKETALHIACVKGTQEAAFALMDMKAKANIRNLLGETALHVVGYSSNSTPKIARAVLSHTIKIHDWVSVNCTDDAGNNALHLAGKFASPDVLWEFRFVRFKDTDIDGNTPLHEAVRPGCEEALHTALDIYESMQRDADINHHNNKGETVLHLAASAGFSDCVTRLIFYGADLTRKDNRGNTVLHRLVRAIVEDSSNTALYMNVVDTILQEAARWSCNVNNERFPSENKTYFQQVQRKAILALVNDFKNDSMLSVLGFASKRGCDVFLKRIVTMPEVMYFERNGTVYYDITHLTPMTNGSNKRCCGEARVQHSVSLIELLVTTDATHHASKVLNLPPFRKIEMMYTSTVAWAYAFLMFLHVAYMSAFTFLGIQMSAQFRSLRNGTSIENTDSLLIATYVIVPLEPLIFLINCIIVLAVMVCRRKISSSESFTILAVNLTFAILTLTWLLLVGMREAYHDYVLSVSLCIGWLYSISFTRGFKQIHYFWKMLLSMLTRDVLRFILVFLFVLMAFSFAFHVLFQVSTEIVDMYTYPFDTMFLVFNTMVGMSDIFTDPFDAALISLGRTSTFPKIMYVVYIVFSTIILLNLLIAMMNDSYSNILDNQQVLWRVDSIKIGISVENLLPQFPKYFGKVNIRHCKITGYNDPVGERWYLIMSKEEIKLLCEGYSTSRETHPLGGVLEEQYHRMEKRVDKIEKVTTENFAKMFALLDKMSKEIGDQ